MALRLIKTYSGNSSVLCAGRIIPEGIKRDVAVSEYIRVKNLAGNKISIMAYIEVLTSAKGTLLRIESMEFAPDMLSADNFVKQAYLHMKAIPEYANAVDC